MNGASPAAGEQLTRALRGFQQAASQLERHHGVLRHEVRQLEGRLLDAHRRLEAVVDALDTGVAVLSSDAQTLRANRAFENMKLDPRALCGELAGTKCGSGSTARMRRHTPAGERDLRITILPVGDAEGTQVVTVQDVTEIREQEEEGGRRRRLEALGRMATELAHEVRNPLGSIRLYASMLRDDLDFREPLQEMAEQILLASSSLESTVSNLLAFARPSSAARRSIDLNLLAADACGLLEPTCSLRQVRLEAPVTGTCIAWADPEGMRQVLLNLLGNSLNATSSGGWIRVKVVARQDRAVLIVEDSGRGITNEDLPRVFDPFFTRSDGGTGLGLSIVHGIIERHEGRISLDSEPGRGTRVRVEIPLTGSAEENA